MLLIMKNHKNIVFTNKKDKELRYIYFKDKDDIIHDLGKMIMIHI